MNTTEENGIAARGQSRGYKMMCVSEAMSCRGKCCKRPCTQCRTHITHPGAKWLLETVGPIYVPSMPVRQFNTSPITVQRATGPLRVWPNGVWAIHSLIGSSERLH